MTNKFERHAVLSEAVFTVEKSNEELASPVADLSAQKNSGEIVPWGENNDLPVIWREKFEASTSALPFAASLVKIYFGSGLGYYQEIRTKDGVEKDFSAIPDVDAFLRVNNIEQLLLERLMDYKILGNCFLEYTINKAYNKIVGIYHLEAEFSRFSKVENNKIKEIHYKSDWTSSEQAEKITYITKRDFRTLDIAKLKLKKFAMHSCFPSPGRSLYAMPPHAGLMKTDGWLDYANSVPGIMNSINKNASDLKWHIKIPYSYWPSIHENWTTLSIDEQNKIIDEKLDEMNKWLSGGKNAGKSFISHFATDPITGKSLAGWEITSLESKDAKDKFLTSIQEADAQTARSIGVDVSLANIQASGGKMGSGSGSDKRTAFTNTQLMSYADALIILEPLINVKWINKWPENLVFYFKYDQPTTLNENHSGVTQNN